MQNSHRGKNHPQRDDSTEMQNDHKYVEKQPHRQKSTTEWQKRLQRDKNDHKDKENDAVILCLSQSVFYVEIVWGPMSNNLSNIMFILDSFL